MAGLLVFVMLMVMVCNCDKFWNDLRVTNDNDLMAYKSLPRTTIEAALRGWNKLDNVCAGNKGYQGYAWMHLSLYPYVTLIFDKRGIIAGIQAGISVEDAKEIGVPSWLQMPPFAKDTILERYIISAYFVKPSTICTTGRTDQDLKTQGTGTGLFIQNGDKVTQLPNQESDIMLPWVHGKCKITLGKHYWYKLNEKMSCDEFFPVFPLYNGGDLNGFGFAFSGNLQNKVFEHANNETLHESLHMKKVPKCFNNIDFSILHVFLTSHPSLNFC